MESLFQTLVSFMQVPAAIKHHYRKRVSRLPAPSVPPASDAEPPDVSQEEQDVYAGSSSDKASLQEEGVAPSRTLSASCVGRGTTRRLTGGTGPGLSRKLISHARHKETGNLDVQKCDRSLSWYLYLLNFRFIRF